MPRGVRAGALYYAFGADTSRLEAGAKRSAAVLRAQQRALRNLQLTVRNTSERFRSFQSRMISVRGAVGLLAGSGALGLLIRRQAQFGSQLVEVSERLGFSVERVQLLQRAFEGEGLAIQQINIGLQRFTRRLADAASGNAQLQGTFRALGVNIRDSQGRLRDSHDVLLDVAEGLKNTEGQAQRVLRSFQLFDSEGVAFVNVLQRGREALLAQQEAFRRLGLVLEEEARALKDLDQSFTDLGNALQVAAARGVAAAADEFQRLNEQLIANGPKAVESMVGAIAHLTENIQALKETAFVFSLFLLARFARNVKLAAGALAGMTLAAKATQLGLSALVAPGGLLAVGAAAFGFYLLRAEKATDRTREFARGVEGAAGRAAQAARNSAAEQALAFEAAAKRIQLQIQFQKSYIKNFEDFRDKITGKEGGPLTGPIAEQARKNIEALEKRLESIRQKIRGALEGPTEEGVRAAVPRPAPVVRDFGAGIAADLARRERAQRQAVALSRLEGQAQAALAAEFRITNKLFDEQARIERELTRALKERAAAAAVPGAFAAADKKVEQLKGERAALEAAADKQDEFIERERGLAIARQKHTDDIKKQNEALAEQERARSAALEGARAHLSFVIGSERELKRRAGQAQEGIRRAVEGIELEQGAVQALEKTEQRRRELQREQLEAALQGDAQAAANIQRQIAALDNLTGWQQRYAAALQKVIEAERLLGELRKNSVKAAEQEFRAGTGELAVENDRFDFTTNLRGLQGEDRAAQQLKNELEERENALKRFRKGAKNLKLLDEGQLQDLDRKIHNLKELREDEEALRKRFGEDISARAEENARARLIALEKQRLELAKKISETLAEGLGQAIVSAKNLGDVLRHTAAALAKIAIQQLLIRRVAGLLSGAIGGLFSAPVSASASAGSLVPINSSSIKLAGGGPVEAGRAYMVGEVGPELFRPRAGGEIIPNYKLRPALGGGGGVAFHFGDINIESTDGPGVRVAMAEAIPVIEDRVSRVVRGQMTADTIRPSPFSAAARS